MFETLKYQLVVVGIVFFLALAGLLQTTAFAQDNEGREGPIPTLGLDKGTLNYDTPAFDLELVKESQTIASLVPKGEGDFDFTPADWLSRRNGDGYYHLGDITLQLKGGSTGKWRRYSTAKKRQKIKALQTESPVLAGAVLNPTLPDNIPLEIRRFWKVKEGHLVLSFELENTSDKPVEVGGLGIPLVFNNILHERDLEEAHAKCSFYDPYIGRDAGYLQVTRLNGKGPALIVVPEKGTETPFEAYKPLLSDSTQRGITFEGFYEWMVHTKAYTDQKWEESRQWNTPTATTIRPGKSRTYGLRFLVADSIRGIEETLAQNERPVAKGLPGYVVPKNQQAHLFLKYQQDIASIDIQPAGALKVEEMTGEQNEWKKLKVQGKQWGQAHVNITYEDGLMQSVNYKVIKPPAEVVEDLGKFLTTEQWFDKPDDPFNRTNSVISYDYEKKQQVTEDNRAWIAGLSDEGGAGAWLAAVMKQLIRPDPEEIKKLEKFVDEVLWGGIQYSEGDKKYGVRKSMFFYEPEDMPKGTYTDSINYGGWSSWDKKAARSVGRSYNYPHVAAAYWVLYRLARNYKGLVTNHSWRWYLERAYQTSEAMVEFAPHYAQFGQMEGTVFVKILLDLQAENWNNQAVSLEKTMRKRAELWESLAFPFGSEMPWDSTGQEEVYAWCKYFGFDKKAQVTLNAILGYMPTVPHWGYNGSARRYWDFLFAGKLSRIERQLHHYGSALNAIPVLAAYRENPDDFYLLRVGYGGLMGSIANITQDGFGPAAFHAFPSALKNDGYSGDYGSGFFGHAINTGTYITDHPEFGWLAFGGNLAKNEEWVQVKPMDSARSRVYLAPIGAWLTLDVGKFEEVRYNSSTKQVELSLIGSEYTPQFRLNIDQPIRQKGDSTITLSKDYVYERGAYVIPLDEGQKTVNIHMGN